MTTTSYMPWYTQQTSPSWDIPLNTDSGPDNLTGVNVSSFAMIFRTAGGVDTTGTGSFTIKSVYPAEILYKPSTADVSIAFNGSLIIKAYFPPSGTSADCVTWDPIAFQITTV